MKTKIHNYYKFALSALIVLFFLISCGGNTSDSEDISENNISKLESLKDSAQTKSDLKYENTAEINAIKDSIDLLLQSNKSLNDSLNSYTSMLTGLDIQIDDLTKKKKYVSDTDQKAKTKITTNIKNLESSINSLKISKSSEESNLEIIGKRKELISKKNETLKTELEFHELELSNLYTRTDAQSKIEELTKKINAINNEILANKNLLIEEDLNEKMSNSKIANFDEQLSLNQKKFKTEYEKSLGIKDYVETEAEDLAYKLNNVELQKAELVKKWKNFKTSIDINTELIEKFELQKNQLLNPISLDNDLSNSSKESVISEKTQQEGNKELNNTQKLIDENKGNEEGSSAFIYWLILIIILVVLGLYMLGKKNNGKNENKDLGDENE